RNSSSRIATRSSTCGSLIVPPSRSAPGMASAPEQARNRHTPAFARGVRPGYPSSGMLSLRRSDFDAVFLAAGNTLITLDHPLVCEVLAAEGVRVAPQALARAEAAARPAVSRLLGGGVSSEGGDTFTFYVRRILERLADDHGRPIPEPGDLPKRVVA